MSSVNHVNSIPPEGKNLIIVANVQDVLHFRAFAADGSKSVEDTVESQLPDKAPKIAELKSLLSDFWGVPELPQSDKKRVISAVKSIVGHTQKITLWFGGKRYPPYPDPDISQNSNKKNYAILVRTFLGKGKQAVPRFICAGLDSFGTFAAGKYLKDRWEVLLKYYEDCHKDLNEYSLAILLSFLGQKIDSADLWVENLCFFCKKNDCTFYFLDSNGNPKERPVKPDQCPNFPECVERYNNNKGAKKDRCPLIPDGSVIEECPLIQQYVNVKNTG
jgi:hypothetical protein